MGVCIELGGPPALPTPTACLRGNESDGGLQYLPTPNSHGQGKDVLEEIRIPDGKGGGRSECGERGQRCTD